MRDLDLGLLTGSFYLLKSERGWNNLLELFLQLLAFGFWDKAYDVPGMKQTKKFAEFLVVQIGNFVGCDECTMFGLKSNILCCKITIFCKLNSKENES